MVVCFADHRSADGTASEKVCGDRDPPLICRSDVLGQTPGDVSGTEIRGVLAISCAELASNGGVAWCNSFGAKVSSGMNWP